MNRSLLNVWTEPPAGFEFTGEFRPPKAGEYFVTISGAGAMLKRSNFESPRVILRKKPNTNNYFRLRDTGIRGVAGAVDRDGALKLRDALTEFLRDAYLNS